MTRHLATLRALATLLSGGARLYLKPARRRTHYHLVVELHAWAARACSAWLRIIHCDILCAFTIPEVVTLVLHPTFRRAAVTVGFRNSPQFDSVAARRATRDAVSGSLS